MPVTKLNTNLARILPFHTVCFSTCERFRTFVAAIHKMEFYPNSKLLTDTSRQYDTNAGFFSAVTGNSRVENSRIFKNSSNFF